MKNNLKSIRKSRRLTLEKLGADCGTSKGHIWELENSPMCPTLRTAYAIARALGCTVYDIWPDGE